MLCGFNKKDSTFVKKAATDSKFLRMISGLSSASIKLLNTIISSLVLSLAVSSCGSSVNAPAAKSVIKGTTGTGVPVLDYQNPASSPSVDDTPIFRAALTGSTAFTPGDVIHLYQGGNNTCNGSLVATSAAISGALETYVDLGPSSAIGDDGTYTYYMKITNLLGASKCSATPLVYVLNTATPEAPEISLNTPSSSPSSNNQPSFDINLAGGANFSNGDVIRLYQGGDNTCSGTLVATSGAQNGSSDFVTLQTGTALNSGNTYTYFAKVTNSASTSSCSPTGLSYFYSPAPSVPVITLNAANPSPNGYSSTPQFDVSLTSGNFAAGDIVRIYEGGNNTCSGTLIATGSAMTGGEASVTLARSVAINNLGTTNYFAKVTDQLGISSCSSTSVAYVYGPISLSNSVAGAENNTVLVDGTMTVYFVLKTSENNLIDNADQTVVFSLSGAGTSAGTFGTVTYNNILKRYESIFSGTTAGTTKKISATVNGAAFTGTEPTVTVQPASIETEIRISGYSGSNSTRISLSESGSTFAWGANSNIARACPQVGQYDSVQNKWVLTELECVTSSNTSFANVATSDSMVAVTYSKDDNTYSPVISLHRLNPTTHAWNGSTIVPSDAVYADSFGTSLAVGTDIVVAGSAYDDDKGADSGSLYIYRYNPNTYAWVESKLTASNGTASDHFGKEVSVSGNTVVTSGGGSVYVYRYDFSTRAWVETILNASDGADLSSVKVSGNTVIAGAPSAASSKGAAYVFQYDILAKTWNEVKLTASDGLANDRFGQSIAISGSTVAVGIGKSEISSSVYIYQHNPVSRAWDESKKAVANDGKVAMEGNILMLGNPLHPQGDTIYIYDLSPQSGPLFASDAADYHQFGSSVAASGNSVIVGAPRKGNNYQGGAYTYQYNASTSSWHESTLNVFADGRRAGASVAISGHTAVVGAPNQYEWDQGEMIVYQYDLLSGAWNSILSDSKYAGSLYGYADRVAVSGNTVVISSLDFFKTYIYQYNPSTLSWGETQLDHRAKAVAVSDNNIVISDHSMNAYVYRYNPSTFAWIQTPLVGSDTVAGDYYGDSVAVSGNTIVVGARGDDDNSGSAYIFQYNPNTHVWKETKIKASDGIAGDFFGTSVSVSGNTVVVGATAAGSDQQGAAYTYRYNPVTHNWDESITPSTFSSGSYDKFGNSVAVSGNNVIVGAPTDETKGITSGAATILTLPIAAP